MSSVTYERVRSRSPAVPALAVLRLGFAAWMWADPVRVARALGAAHPEDLRWAVLAAGAREALLGTGAAVAWARHRSTAEWVLAMAAADATDALLYVVGSRLGRLEPTAARRGAWLAVSGVVGEGVTAAWIAADS